MERLPRCDGLLLTFDDGPHPEVTPAVLDLLAKYNARAVFFVVGDRIPRATHMLNRILAEGHIIGNHTYRHPLDHVPSIADYYRDVEQCQAEIERRTTRRPELFRPPLGSITPASLLVPLMTSLRTLLWSIDVDDWTLRHDQDAVQAGRRLAEIAGPGDVVLLHDDNPCVVTLLETALPILTQRQMNLDEALVHLERRVSKPTS
jgi:peptidoglycan/xylan/chitin deacetylase (PgdA/CDA1 family)